LTNTPAKHKKITLRQVLTCLRTKICWEVPLFTQVHYWNEKDTYIGICHKKQHEEAKNIIRVLPTLLKERFGNKIEAWFEDETLAQASFNQFDDHTKKVITNSFCDYAHFAEGANTNLSDAEIQNLRNEGRLEDELNRYQEEYEDESVDSDTEEKEDNIKASEEWVFNLEDMFKLEPAIRAGPHRDQDSLATNATGASQASRLAARMEIDEDEDSTEQQTGEKGDG